MSATKLTITITMSPEGVPTANVEIGCWQPKTLARALGEGMRICNEAFRLMTEELIAHAPKHITDEAIPALRVEFLRQASVRESRPGETWFMRSAFHPADPKSN